MEVILEIQQDGSIKTTIEGCEDDSCHALTDKIAELLGAYIEDRQDDYNVQVVTTTRSNIKRG